VSKETAISVVEWMQTMIYACQSLHDDCVSNIRSSLSTLLQETKQVIKEALQADLDSSVRNEVMDTIIQLINSVWLSWVLHLCVCETDPLYTTDYWIYIDKRGRRGIYQL